MNTIRTYKRSTITMLLLFISACAVLVANQSMAQISGFGSGPSPLSPEEAFKPSIQSTDSANVLVQFDIADEYYLYEKRFNFSTDNDAISIGEPVFTEAIVHEDEYFGKSNIFRNQTVVSVPVSAATATEFDLNVGYQGCADLGLCYPPTKTTLKVNLPASAASNDIPSNVVADANTTTINPLPKIDLNKSEPSNIAATPGSVDISDFLNKSSSFGGDEFGPLLGPQEAFIPSIQRAGDNQIEVRWFIAPDYYLYRDKIDFKLVDAGSASVESFDVDRGVMQNDAYFGDVEILREVPSARITLNNAEALSNATLLVKSQGCADIGVCFPPETISLPVSFTNTVASVATAATGSSNGSGSGTATKLAAGSVATTAETGLLATQASSTATTTLAANAQTQQSATSNTAIALPETEQNKLTRLLEAGNLGFIAFAFYIAGVLLAFTACMYPMIPILSSLIVGQGEKIGAMRAFSLSLIYVLSMASVFAVVGILVGLSGYNIQPLFQNPWVLSAFAGLFVVLALSMFGLFQLQMPNSIQSKMTQISNNQKGGSVTGVAVMGMLSALIVGPCVTPPLVAALAYIANTGDARIGGIALFAIGIGMGTPLLFIGTSLGRFMPKAGGWMETTQRIFGIVLLAVAIYMLSRFLPANVIMMMSAVLAIFTGVFFGATDKLDHASRGSQRFGKSAGLVALVYGIVLMVGTLSGSNSLLSPLKGIAGTSGTGVGIESEDAHLVFQRVKTVDDLDNVLAEAKAANRPVMFDFYADWCISCKEMEAFTFPDAKVKAQLTDAVLIQADVTKNDEADKALLKRFSLFGPPAIMLYDRTGTELTAGRVVGYMNAEKFSGHLQAYLN